MYIVAAAGSNLCTSITLNFPHSKLTMLGNKDFAKMLTGGGLSSRGESSFDLKKTISQWDKDQKQKETL